MMLVEEEEVVSLLGSNDDDNGDRSTPLPLPFTVGFFGDAELLVLIVFVDAGGGG